jgi:hypothetical protein
MHTQQPPERGAAGAGGGGGGRHRLIVIPPRTTCLQSPWCKGRIRNNRLLSATSWPGRPAENLKPIGRERHPIIVLVSKFSSLAFRTGMRFSCTYVCSTRSSIVL